MKLTESTVRELLKNENLYADEIIVSGDTLLEVTINNGDWKHEHIRLNHIIANSFDIILSNEEVTESDGSDCYSAIHRYMIKAW